MFITPYEECKYTAIPSRYISNELEIHLKRIEDTSQTNWRYISMKWRYIYINSKLQIHLRFIKDTSWIHQRYINTNWRYINSNTSTLNYRYIDATLQIHPKLPATFTSYNFGVRQISSETLNYHCDLHNQARNKMRRMLRAGAPVSLATVVKYVLKKIRLAE
ncbi:uncharacterized protein [Spinacia oleracea]|uniref:Uncharacterized protein isoform X1 n=1 Tax=Spinacia oleracea TaxID=3562 RepID=A0ABM3RBI2_SPIOL|nr:uncharacterized protein LOC110777933 isoform X1 [Spinacia oleracea]XP_056692957.1 uncharacterized protein LOC110777933 isoform X1 [Spinacia oleracea]